MQSERQREIQTEREREKKRERENTKISNGFMITQTVPNIYYSEGVTHRN